MVTESEIIGDTSVGLCAGGFNDVFVSLGTLRKFPEIHRIISMCVCYLVTLVSGEYVV